MSTRIATSALAFLISFSLIAPTAFFVAPQKVHATPVEVVADVSAPSQYITAAKTAFMAIKETLIEIHTYTSAVAEWAQYINTYVLQPLAFVLSGQLTKQLTAAVIGFVIGKANGTGVPQFVVDVNKSMRTVADGPALAYLKNMDKTRSPFSYSISNALKSDYLKKTSLEGFWAANMNTLDRSSPNVPAYLAGNWSQGGVAAWFSLTTEVQNNPFTLYQSAQAQVGTVIGPGVGGATGSRKSQLDWGKGFMSWCGGSDSASSAPSSNSQTATDAYNACIANGNTTAECRVASDAYLNAGTGGVAINPGDPCTNADGTQGTIKTPGSVISGTLQKVLGGQQDQIVRMGNIGPEINGILSDIGTVMKTVNFAADILGGGSSGSGGLISAGASSGVSAESRLAQFAGNINETSYFGITPAHIIQSAKTDPSLGTGGSSATSTTEMAVRVKMYQEGWSTISAAAATASSSVNSLIDFCTSAAAANNTFDPTFAERATAQATAGKVALATYIAPVLTQAAQVPAIIAAALAMDTKVQTEAANGSSAYVQDSLALQNMVPTSSDVSFAAQNALVLGQAVATPEGSLTVPKSSSVSTVDQMNLLSKNAESLKSTCIPFTTLNFI